MANSSLYNKVVHLDTFSAIIDFADIYPNGMKLHSIEWSRPTSTDHTFTILTGGSSGPAIFREQCTTANQSVIKYFQGGVWVEPLYFAVAASNEKASGHIIITLETP